MNARPTEYKGILFRSIAEARWAAFMDLIGWKWCYEPAAFGNYIPDFLVSGPYVGWKCGKPCDHCNRRDGDFTFYLEVKGGALAHKAPLFEEAKTKAKAANLDHRILIVGAMPSVCGWWLDANGWSPGKIMDEWGREDSPRYASIVYWKRYWEGAQVSREELLSYSAKPCWIDHWLSTSYVQSGCNEYETPTSSLNEPQAWAVACNTVQWRAPQPFRAAGV